MIEKLVDALLGAVLEVQEVDHSHVDLLAVAMAAADALLDALRVPRQIEIDDQRAELKVDAFRAGFRRNEDRLAFAEGFDDGGLHVRRLRAGYGVATFVARQPVGIDRLALRIVVLAVMRHDLPA